MSIKVAKITDEFFQLKNIAGFYAVTFCGDVECILSVGDTKKSALENFEQAAARFIRSEHMKAMPAMVGAR